MKSKLALMLSAGLCLAVLSPAGAGVMGVLEIRGMDNVAGAVLELSQAVGEPVPKEIITMGVNGLLGSPAGVGLEPNGTIRALWLDNDTPAGALALQLPVPDDGSAYLSALADSGWSSDSETADGLIHLAAPAGQFSLWPEAYALKGERTLLAAQTAGDVRAAAEAAAGLPAILPVEGVAAVQIHPAALVEAYGDRLAAQMEEAFDAVPDEAGDTAAMGRLYIKGYLAVARQIQSFAEGIGVGDGHLSLHVDMTPVAGSRLARWVATIESPSPATGVVNLPGAIFSAAAHLGDLSLIQDPYFRYMEQLLGLMSPQMSADAMTDYVESLKTYWEQSGSDFGLAVLTPTREAPLRMAEYLSVRNPVALRGLNARMVGAANDLIQASMAAAPSQPFTFELVAGEPREYREIPIDRLIYRLTAGPDMAEIWPEGRTLELVLEQAWLPDAVLVGIGDSGITDQLVDRALDGTATPVSDLDAWKAFFPRPEPGLLEMAHASVFDGLREYLGLLDSVTAAEMAQAIPAGRGNLSWLSYRSPAGIRARMRFGLDDLGAITRKVQEAQERGRAAAQAQMEQFQRELEEEGYDFQELDDAEDDDWDDSGDDDADDWGMEEDEDDAEADLFAPAEPIEESAPMEAVED
jgi:hypothetical protein